MSAWLFIKNIVERVEAADGIEGRGLDVTKKNRTIHNEPTNYSEPANSDFPPLPSYPSFRPSFAPRKMGKLFERTGE